MVSEWTSFFRGQKSRRVSHWRQIHRDFPLESLLAGWVYLRWLRARRWLRYGLGRSGRTWRRPDLAPLRPGVRILD